MDRATLLNTARDLILGDRNRQNGDPKINMSNIAVMWSTYKGVDFTPYDVAAMMILVKVCRLRFSPKHLDNWIDTAGYAACGAECLEIEELPEIDEHPWEPKGAWRHLDLYDDEEVPGE